MNNSIDKKVLIIGAGLAGSDAAYYLAERGISVVLLESKTLNPNPAQKLKTGAELVCTNSFKSIDPTNAHGQLKREMRLLESLLLKCADKTSVPAGSALAVDRGLFSQMMTEIVGNHPLIRLDREEVVDLPETATVVATGPLTSDGLSSNIQEVIGEEGLSFYDAIAPIVHKDSLNLDIVFEGGRYEEKGDYLNCPMSESEYDEFTRRLLNADVYQGPEWDAVPYFEGCLPIEVMAERGLRTVRSYLTLLVDSVKEEGPETYDGFGRTRTHKWRAAAETSV